MKNMIFILLLASIVFTSSCFQQDMKVKTTKHLPKDSEITIYYKIPPKVNLELTYYDNFYRPVDILLKGKETVDSFIITSNQTNFLDNKHSIYEVWSVMIRPGDRLFLEYSGDKKAYSSFKIKSLNDSSRSRELNFYTSYNIWRKENRAHHAILNKKLAYWKNKNNIDSVFEYQNIFYKERLNFLENYRKTNSISKDCYQILSATFYAGLTKARFIMMNSILRNNEKKRRWEINSLLKDLSHHINQQPQYYLNAHLLIVASIITKSLVSSHSSFDQKAEKYISLLNHYFSGKTKNLLLLNFFLSVKSHPELAQSMKKFETQLKDTLMLNYFQHEIKALSLSKHLPPGVSYGISNNGNVVSVDSLIQKYRGKKILINLWASWCAPCVQELEKLVPAAEAFDTLKYAFIFLSVDNSRTGWTQAQKSLNMTSLKHSYLLAKGIDSKILKDYKIEGFPTNIFINEKGKLITKHVGILLPGKMEQIFSRE